LRRSAHHPPVGLYEFLPVLAELLPQEFDVFDATAPAPMAGLHESLMERQALRAGEIQRTFGKGR